MTLKDQGRDPKHLILNISTTARSAEMGQIPRFTERILVNFNIRLEVFRGAFLTPNHISQIVIRTVTFLQVFLATDNGLLSVISL